VSVLLGLTEAAASISAGMVVVVAFLIPFDDSIAATEGNGAVGAASARVAAIRGADLVVVTFECSGPGTNTAVADIGGCASVLVVTGADIG